MLNAAWNSLKIVASAVLQECISIAPTVSTISRAVSSMLLALTAPLVRTIISWSQELALTQVIIFISRIFAIYQQCKHFHSIPTVHAQTRRSDASRPRSHWSLITTMDRLVQLHSHLQQNLYEQEWPHKKRTQSHEPHSWKPKIAVYLHQFNR